MGLSQLIPPLALITVGQSITFGCITAISYFLYKGFRARLLFSKLRQAGMPMPPWNPFLGHLLIMPGILQSMPKDSQQTDAFVLRSRRFGDTDSLYYLDLWPFSDPFLIVSSPDYAVQACQEHDLIKPASLNPFFQPLAGGDNLFTMNGPTWKSSRALFSAGFNSRYILNQTSHIVDEAKVYLEKLRAHAKERDMFSLDDVTLWYTMDIIGAVNFNARLHSQTTHNELAAAMRSQISWQCLNDELNPFIRWNPIRPLMQWYNGRRMNQYISKELEKSFGRLHERKSLQEAGREQDTCTKIRPSFKAWAVTQIRQFIFAGHDSTSSTICYCFYLLQHNPEAMRHIRDEHDRVCGTDIEHLPDMLFQNPDLLNKLPYTDAVMKESMRLFPAASATRGGRPDVFLKDKSSGRSYPTADKNIWIIHSALHRNPKYWPRPNEFIPQRWLVDQNDLSIPSRELGDLSNMARETAWDKH